MNNDREYSLKCPICSEKLMILKINNGMTVYDGNTVISCIKNNEHRFWKNAREHFGILHLNKNATQTNFNSEKTFVWDKTENKFILEDE